MRILNSAKTQTLHRVTGTRRWSASLQLAAVLCGTGACLGIPGNYILFVPQGAVTMANHLYRGSNTLAEVLPNVQPGTRVFKFDPGSGGYYFQEFNPPQGGWVPNPLETLHPGEGAWIQSPVPQTLNFIGINVPSPTRPRLPAGRYFVSCPAPQPASFEVLMGFPPIVGDRVIQYTNVYPSVPQPPAQASSVHTFGQSGWDVVPTVPLGQSVFVDLAPVPASNAPPQLAPLFAQVIHAGMTVQFAAMATDPDLPPNQLTFSLDPGAPPTAFIDPLTGAFSWTTTDADAEQIHDITVRVTDNGAPPMSATQMFSVVVMPRPEESIQVSSNLVTLTWSSIPGMIYRLLRAPHLTGLWTNVGPDVLATNVTTTKEDTFAPTIPEGYYRITTTTTNPPLTNVGSFCVLLKSIVGGPGLTADNVAPAAGETTVMTTDPMPFIVTGGDRDQLLQTCVCFASGGFCAKTVPHGIMDSVTYAWTLAGGGTLQGSGPAVLFVPPELMIGETNIAILTATITESRGNDAPATITYTQQLVREDACTYRRTVTIDKVIPPGTPVAGSGACDCAPAGPVWFAAPPLQANAPKEVVACVGERFVLSANGSDSDLLFILCVSATCGSPGDFEVLIDELNYTWSATTGTFPDYGGAPVSNSRETSVIYKAPDQPGEDTVTIQVQDSGQGGDAMVEKKIKVKVFKVDLQMDGVSEANEECLGRFLSVNHDDDDANGKLDRDDTTVTNENDLVMITLIKEAKEGNVTLRAATGGDKIKVWTKASKVTEITLPFTVPASKLPTNLWVEGIKASAKVRDVELVLESEEQVCRDKARLTVVDLRLNTDLDLDNDIDDTDRPLKTKRGAYLVVNNDDDDRDDTVDTADGEVVANAAIPGSQDENNLKRFSLSLILPEELRQTGVVRVARSAGQMRAYSDPKKGVGANNNRAVLWSDAVGTFAAATEDNGRKSYDLSVAAERTAYAGLATDGLWVEGLEPSAAERDQQLTVLYIPPGQTAPLECDWGRATSVRFEELRATPVEATPAHTVRANAPADHSFTNMEGGIVHYLDENTTDRDRNFDLPWSLVLIRRSGQGNNHLIPLVITRQPDTQAVRWKITRSTDDAGGLGAGTPALTADGDSAANLGTDERGSFLVSCYVDANQNSDFDLGEPRTILPFILVEATMHQDLTTLQPANITIARRGTAVTWTNLTNGIIVRSGTFDIANPANAAIYLAAHVDYVGGGGDGRRGLDRTFGGWINNEVAVEDIRGSYQGGHFAASVFANNAPGDGWFLPGDPAPVLVAPPLLDSGRENAGTGGETATLTRSRMVTNANLALGRRLLIEAVDSPGQGYPAEHPGFPGSFLTNVRFNLDFGAWLSYWTNRRGNAGVTADPAERAYSVGLEFTWQLRGEWTIDANGVATQIVAPDVTRAGSTTHNPQVRARDRTVEVRPPTGLSLLATDGRN